MAICRMCWTERESLAQRQVPILGVATVKAVVCRGCLHLIQRSLNFLHMLGLEQDVVSPAVSPVQLEIETGEELVTKPSRKAKKSKEATDPDSIEHGAPGTGL